MEFKGTKGEWRVGNSDGIKTEKGFKSKYVVETNSLIVCDFITSKGYAKQAKYDSKLIAAAPDLLKALQDLLNVDEIDVHLKYKLEINAQKAINKALN